MYSSVCSFKQQQHSKPLAQSVFKVSAFRYNMHRKTSACLTVVVGPTNNALIKFVPSCQNTRIQLVYVLDPPFALLNSTHFVVHRT